MEVCKVCFNKLHVLQEKIRRERERLQREQEEIEREKALLEQKKAQEEKLIPHYQPISNASLYVDSRSPTGSSVSSLSPTQRTQPRALDPKHHETQNKKVPPPTAPKPDKGAKARLTRDDLLAMNRKATPLAKPETVESSAHNDSVSPTVREAPSKGELHSLNAVPKQKFRSNAEWIKDGESAPHPNTRYSNTQQNERPFVIGNRSDLIHKTDYSNPSDHWLVREAEKRRVAEAQALEDRRGVTARAGPAIPSQSSLVNRFRSDREPPPRRNRLSYPSTEFGDPRDPPSRPLSSAEPGRLDRGTEKGITTQFSARSQPNTFASNPSLSQTLPPSLSFNARNHDTSAGSKPPRALSENSDPTIAVSGKQKCSHCGEELGRSTFLNNSRIY